MDKVQFSNLPQPPTRYNDDRIIGRFHPRLAYLEALESLAEEINHYINTTIQAQETVVTSDYSKRLRALGDNNESAEQAERDATDDFNEEMRTIKAKRAEYRRLYYKIINEKKKLIESMRVNRAEEDFVKQKLDSISSLHPEAPDRSPRWNVSSIFYLFLLICTIVIFVVSETWPWDYFYSWNNGTTNRVADFFLFFTHIAIFVFVGFPLLNSYMRKYQYSGLVFSLLVAAWAFLWTILWRNLWGNIEGGLPWERDRMTIYTIIAALYGATVALVVFSAILGRVTLIGLVIITFFATFWYNANNYLCLFLLRGVDYAGPNSVWLFAGSFGIAVATFMILPGRVFASRKVAWVDTAFIYRRDRLPSYYSNVFAIIGTLILFVTFPSFNGAFAPNAAQFRVVINVIIAICTSVVFAFLASRVFRGGKWHMLEIQRATLAGGIACSSAFAQGATPGGAMVLGAAAGLVATISYAFFNPVGEKRFGAVDESGVFSYAFLPALTGSIAAIIQTALVAHNRYVFGNLSYLIYPLEGSQAGHQAAILFISIGLGLGGGILTGFLVWLIEWGLSRLTSSPRVVSYYSDEPNFLVPNDFERTIHSDGPLPVESDTQFR
eukprot:TRINITY_DN6058_c0_g1_i1.p1 TRINITY_DN6058_c0_g1~~TRINITY_DN6058_c0_g1_i1.p1  ORF type:complete len:609 (-),score=106.25 TRINITY_DN6058_c0_g1_i1:112-1938(-)